MALESIMLPLGTPAPSFFLPEVVSGKRLSLEGFKDKPALLVMFICQHCPYVVHVRNELARLGQDYIPRKVGIVAISSNDVSRYPEDSPEHLKRMALELGLNFPVCYDETQETAKAYRAACTPEFYLFDADRKLVYRGQLDESRPKNGLPVTGKDLREALEALLSGKPISQAQKPSIGCGIKWKPGNEPNYG
jgi:thiol-disulfide isomerase/thioredoxin